MRVHHWALLALIFPICCLPVLAQDYYNGHYYGVIPWSGNWQDARDDATTYTWDPGGALFTCHLAAVTTEAENEFIVATYTGSVDKGAFLGGYQCDVGDGLACPAADGIVEPDGGWKWVTGEPFDYTNWDYRDETDYEPNNLGGDEHFLQYYPQWSGVKHTGFWNDVYSTGWVGEDYIAECDPPEAVINIKPGSDPNSISPCSRGTTPVAILGSDVLDVTTIDPDELVLASSYVKTVGKSDHNLCSFEDIGSFDEAFSDKLNPEPDGYLDMVCHFVTYGLGLGDDSTTADLTITGLGGVYVIVASDSVHIVKDCEP